MKTRVKYGFLIAAIFATVTAPLFEKVFANKNLPTYFNYDQSELASLKNLSSTHQMTPEELRKWDTIMFNQIKQHKLSGIPASFICTYVTTAQRDAAFLSTNLHHEFMGSLDPVSSKVLCLFLPSDCKNLKEHVSSDPYSDKLADIVVAKVKSRLALDKKQMRMSPQTLNGVNYWAGKKLYVGQDTGSAMTWLVSSPKAFLPQPPPPPESPEWQTQLSQTKEALKNITSKQVQSIHDWAGNPGSITSSGIWLEIANKAMDQENASLTKRLKVRSILTMGLEDAFITVFNAKYTYWVKRPFMLDPSLQTVLPTPNHPSYPAGHATLSATAATILSHYFPQKRQEWWSMADEACQGRVQAGIHFPIDIKEGLFLGKKVGAAAVNSPLS